MEISKFKLVLKYLTGGLSSVAEYALEEVNKQFKKLPKDKVKRYSDITDSAAGVVALCAKAMKDGQLTAEEIADIVKAAKELAEQWKAERD